MPYGIFRNTDDWLYGYTGHMGTMVPDFVSV